MLILYLIIGHNSYYYAHSLRINGPKWDGKEEPRLLAVDPTASAKTSVKSIISAFSSYSWADDGKNIKIYIDHDEADKIDSTNISIVSFICLHNKYLLILSIYLSYL